MPEEVYEPREDSFLAAKVLEEEDLEGKKVLDLGTGTGILAIIASRNGGKVLAADKNPEAVKYAKSNAERNGIELKVKKSNLFGSLDDKFDLIVFNAPYLPGDGRYDKMEDLSWKGGEKGNELILNTIEKAKEYLNEKGRLLLVQSSRTGRKETMEKLEEEGFETRIVREKKVPWENLLVIEAILV
ncbi:MAG: methyltransferase [Candidatus Nanohaloarchaeota archaeon QJJ-9]|nr:methyltransferase [Candidatus Nanohaloarchaeota archaeon QJJ-9]